MRVQKIITAALVGAGSTFAQTDPRDVGTAIVKGIGGLMGFMTPMIPLMGLSVDLDMRDMLCKGFEGNSMIAKIVGPIFGNPNGPTASEKCEKDNSGGSGAFKSKVVEDADLPEHTIYVPENPGNEKLPIIAWANGFCLPAGMMFANFLAEIASHGFIIISNGGMKIKDMGKTTNYKEQIKALDWAVSDKAKKYGNIDTRNIAVAGQSCGGINVYGAMGDPRVNLTVLFNSGDFDRSAQKLIATTTTEMAWFLGGPKDIGQGLGDYDYGKVPNNVPSLKTTADIGHIGTFYQKYGGRMGKAAVAFFSWRLKGDTKYKSLFCDPSPDSELSKLGFKTVTKNGMC